MRRIQLKYLIKPEFQAAYDYLLSSNLPLATAFTLLKVNDELGKCRDLYENNRMALLDKFAKKGESGELLVDDSRTSYVIDDKSTYDKEFDLLVEQEVEIPQIHLSSLKDIKITPKALLILLKTIITQAT